MKMTFELNEGELATCVREYLTRSGQIKGEKMIAVTFSNANGKLIAVADVTDVRYTGPYDR